MPENMNLPEVTAALSTMGEAAMRDYELPWPRSEDELTTIVRSLVNRQHDYGTCVYAMSMAAVAAFNYVASALGVTGFQASCADLDVLRRTRSLEVFRVVDASKLLYPQYLTREHFPTQDDIEADCGEWLGNKARALLTESPNAHPDVVARWQELAARYPVAGVPAPETTP